MSRRGSSTGNGAGWPIRFAEAGLLRVLQKNEIKPLGETRVKHVDVRIVAATNRDMKQMIVENTFRQDLFYRLSVLPQKEEGVVQLRVNDGLEDGEYCLTPEGSDAVFCFTVY